MIRKKVMRPRAKKPGTMPGSLVFQGERRAQSTRITLFDYDEHQLTERELGTPDECLPFKARDSVTWINVDGLSETAVLESFGRIMGFHPLMLEDILNTDQRPKFEDYGDYVYIVLKMLEHDPARDEVTVEQLSLILGPGYVITFQERPGDVLDPVRNRLRKGIGRIRKMGADYLAYALLDVIVDHYFVALEKLGDKVEPLEEIVIRDPKPGTEQRIFQLKRETIFLRRAAWPLRELVTAIQRSESALVREPLSHYWRDLYDHVIQVVDIIDSFRDLLGNMMDSYYSTVSSRTNSVMKVLALFSTIFLPLTFITGIFGMNFQHFPELEWRYGFQGSIALMLISAVAMVAFFRWKRWL